MASFWSWLWDKIRWTLDPDGWIKLDRDTVQDAVQIINTRLEQEAQRRQVRELRVEDLSPEERKALYDELEGLLKPVVQSQIPESLNQAKGKAKKEGEPPAPPA